MPTAARQHPLSRSRSFETKDGITLHSLYWGTEVQAAEKPAAPVILLHGGGANAHWWDAVAIQLALNRPLYALEFRGHGDSSYPTKREVGAFNTDLEALVSSIGREDVVLIGHSMGAAVALDHASRLQDTRGLVLVDPARGGPPGGGRRARLALARRRTYPTREDAIARFQFLPESSHPDEKIRSYIAEHSIRDEPNGRFGYKFDPKWFSLPSKPRPNLADVRCQTLLVRGEASPLLSSETARDFVSELPSAELIEIPGSGHHVLIDQPNRLFLVVETFLRSLGV
ncbi:MAG: alpha/beta hydrolase [Myxococcota bacterium]